VKYLLSYHVRKIQEIENGNDNGGKATPVQMPFFYFFTFYLFFFSLKGFLKVK